LALVYTYDSKREQLSYAAGQDRAGPITYYLPPPRIQGLTYKAARSGKRQIIEDTLRHPEFSEWGSQEGISAIASLPLRVEERVLGVLNVVLDRAYYSDNVQLEVLGVMASQAAAALNNAIQHEKMQQQAQDAKNLEVAVGQLTRTSDVRSTLERVAEHVPHLLETAGTVAALYNDVGREAQSIGCAGVQARLLAELVAEPSTSPFVESILAEDLLCIENLQQTALVPQRNRRALQEVGIRALLALRLAPSGPAEGLLLIALREPFEQDAQEHKLSLFQVYADQSVVAIERARLFERLRKERGLLEEIATATSAMKNLEEIWRNLLQQTMLLTGAERGDISLVNAETGCITTVVAFSHSEKEVQMVEHDATGVHASVIESQEPLAIPPLDESDVWRSKKSELETPPSIVAVPILDRQSSKTIGVIYQESDRTAAFNSEDLRLLQSAALHAGIAWMYHEWSRHARSRAHYLELALQASRRVIAVRRADADALYAIANSLLEMFEYDSVVLFPYHDHEDRCEEPVIAGKLREKQIGLSKVVTESRVMGLIRGDMEKHFSNDSQNDSILKGNFVTRERICSSGYVRLNVAGEIVGVLFVNSCSQHTFSDDEVDAVCLFANLAGLAIYNVRQYSRLQDQLSELKLLVPSHNKEGLPSLAESISTVTDAVLKWGYDTVGIYSFDPFRQQFTAPELRGEIVHYDAVIGSVRLTNTVVGRRRFDGPDNYYTDNPGEAADLHFGEFVRREGIRASASIRLYSQGKFVGLMFANKKEAYYFTQDDKERLERTSQRLANHLLDEFKRQRDIQRRNHISRIRSEMGKSLDLKEVVDQLYASLKEMFGGNTLPALLLYNEREQNLHFLYTEHFGNTVDVPHESNRKTIALDEGVCGWVAQHLESLRVEDVHCDDRYLCMHSLTRSELAVPIVDRDNRLIGVLDVESPISSYFDEQDERWLQEVAAEIVISVWKAEQYRRRGEMLEAFQQSIQPVMESTDRQTTFKAILTAAARLTKSHLATIQQLRETRLYFEAVYPPGSLTTLEENLGDWMSLEGKGMTVEVANSGTPILENDISKSKTFLTGGVAGTNAALAVPILREDDSVWGVLNVESRHKNAFDSEHCQALQSLASLLVVALNNAERATELTHAHSVAVMGAWGAAIAHDVNREVSHIRMTIQILKKKFELGLLASSLDKIDRHASHLSMPEWPEPYLEPEFRGQLSQLQEVLDQLKKDFDEELENRPGRIHLVMEADHTIQVGMHEYWLRRVLEHLIHNAISAIEDGPQNGTVRISAQREEGQLNLRIQDTGKGLPEELIPSLFVQPVRRPDGTVGWGLLLVSYIINAHKGELHLEETPTGVGTCFSIRLPLCPYKEKKINEPDEKLELSASNHRKDPSYPNPRRGKQPRSC
jgi:GAF domain-containing protein